MFMMCTDKQSFELIGLYKDKAVMWNTKYSQNKIKFKSAVRSDISFSLKENVEDCKTK